MTLRQEAYEKMAGLPDASIRLVIALVDEMRKQSELNKASTTAQANEDGRTSAFQELMAFRQSHPFPKDMDIEKIREEAIAEKYGCFD